MPVFKHILFPVDFSEQCRALRPFVLAMARRFDARITLMHALLMPSGWYDGTGITYGALVDFPKMEDDTRRELIGFMEESYPNIEYVVGEDEPARCIVSYAARHGVDLIMMPTHGYGPFRRLLLGSVTAKVLHDAACSVWTSAHAEEPNQVSHNSISKIICAVDLTPESASLIPEADALARRCGAQLRLVHTVGQTPGSPDGDADLDFRHFLLQVGREGLAKLVQQAGITVATDVEEGSVSAALSGVAKKVSADLVIIGHGRLQETLGQFRTNSYAIIRDSPCPVLSLRTL